MKSSSRVVKSVDRRCTSAKSQQKEDTSAPNVREVAKCCVCSMICVSSQSKSRPVKAAGCGGTCSAEKSKIARRCSAKHILKSKCTKHPSSETLFEVPMSKNCTPLWREAHFEVKMLSEHFAKSAFTSQNVKKLTVSEHCLKFPELPMHPCRRIQPLQETFHQKKRLLFAKKKDSYLQKKKTLICRKKRPLFEKKRPLFLKLYKFNF